jgi:small subunit ribosomal protein S6
VRTYEVMTIHRPELADADVETHVGEIRSFLEGKGATITATDMWGKRRLAYEIEHLNEGFYTVVTFEAETDVIDEVDRMLSLSDPVLRHKVVRPGT